VSDASLTYRLRDRAGHLIGEIDAALERCDIDEAGWHARVADLIRPAYLAASTPQSGSPATTRRGCTRAASSLRGSIARRSNKPRGRGGDFVRTGLEYVPPQRRCDLVTRLLGEVVADDGRLIIGVYSDEDPAHPGLEEIVRGWGFSIAGHVARPHRSRLNVTLRVFWIDGPSRTIKT
jgi:hypothetical protein